MDDEDEDDEDDDFVMRSDNRVHQHHHHDDDDADHAQQHDVWGEHYGEVSQLVWPRGSVFSLRLLH